VFHVIVAVDVPVTFADTFEMTGATRTDVYVYWSAELVALVPPAVVTVTSTVPVPAGAIAVSDVLLATTTPVAGVEPNWTEVAPVRLVPVTVTLVPPVVVPLVGEMPVTVGAFGNVLKLRTVPGTHVVPSYVHAVKKYVVPAVIGKRPAGMVADESSAENGDVEATAPKSPVE